jgi:hypothetical protein
LADSRNVVRAKAARPRGAGSAIPGTAVVLGLGWTVRSSLTLKSIPPSGGERLVRLPAHHAAVERAGCPSLLHGWHEDLWY